MTTLAYKIVNESPSTVRSKNSAIPVAVDAVMARAVSKSPDARFPSCGIFVAALERSFSGAAEEPMTPTTTMSIPRQRASQTPLVAAAAGSVVAPMAYQLRANAKRSSGDVAGARQDMRRFRELKPSNEVQR